MFCKVLGSILVVISCGSLGFQLAASHFKEEKSLRQLINILDFMECELQYRRTPLPELCSQASSEVDGDLKEFFISLKSELINQQHPLVSDCISDSLKKHPNIPKHTVSALQSLAQSLGRFDIEGQLKGLDSVRQECRRKADELNKDKESRRRGYQTLGLCAGAALAIILL